MAFRHYPPELQAELTLVNFTVTPLGLEDQLLSLVIRKERPDLAARKPSSLEFDPLDLVHQTLVYATKEIQRRELWDPVFRALRIGSRGDIFASRSV